MHSPFSSWAMNHHHASVTDTETYGDSMPFAFILALSTVKWARQPIGSYHRRSFDLQPENLMIPPTHETHINILIVACFKTYDVLLARRSLCILILLSKMHVCYKHCHWYGCQATLHRGIGDNRRQPSCTTWSILWLHQIDLRLQVAW